MADESGFTRLPPIVVTPDDTGGFAPAADTAGFTPAADTAGFTPAADTDGFAPAPTGNAATRAFWNMLEPITSYPSTYAEINRKTRTGMSEGIDMITGDAERGRTESRRLQAAKGVGWTALNALGYVFSPIDAGLRTVVGNPVEKTLGIPKEYTELAAGLAIPGYGFTRLPGAKQAGQTIQKIFSPETLDVHADNAASLLRSRGGQAARDTATTEDALEPLRAMVNQADDASRMRFISHVEGRQAGPLPPELQTLADKMRDAAQLREDKLKQLPSTAQMDFVDDYVAHFWKDPNGTPVNASTFAGAGKQGSAASTHARSVPTYEDGIAMGLQPLTTDPIEMTMRYVTSMDKFIAATSVLDTAKAQGTVIYRRPQTMGASGNPNSFRIPPGYAPLEGRGATNAAGEQAYAPEGFARVYNNFISQGYHATQEGGSAYDTARRGTNAITALELGLSGYHMATMTQEAMVNGIANGIAALRQGRIGEGVKEIATAGFKPVTYAVKGKEVQNVYLGKTPGTQEMREITDLLTEAGGRAKGTGHAPDYEFSGLGSYVTSFKRAALGKELSQDLRTVTSAPISGTAKVFAKHVGRVMSTVAQPIFEKYIPILKNGAFSDNMSQWLRFNPTASREERVRAARQIWDSVDNRFGEMVQDNVFMNKTLKQTAMLAARSWSWTMGSTREIAGGVRDVARAPFKQPQGIAPNDRRWTQKMDYVIALPLTYGALASVYQYLKTGEPPRDMRDVVAPRTGGVDQQSGEPERLLMPGYMKDVFGFLEHPLQEATNKLGTAPRMLGETLSIAGGQGGKDWRGDPIISPPGREASWPTNVPRWMGEYYDYLTRSVGPISVRNVLQGQKTGSNLNPVETAIGVRTAPRQFIDPEGHNKMLETMRERAWRGKVRHDIRQDQRYQGPDE